MKQQRWIEVFVVLIVFFVFLTSFKSNRKPHLIVGLWKITEEHAIPLMNSKEYINQLFFSSDQLTSKFTFTTKKGKDIDQGLRLAYQIEDQMEGFIMPVVYFINTCDKEFKLAFAIKQLTKDTLELKWIKEVSSPDILLNREVLTFERIGGPPENMSSSGSPEQIEIKADEEK